MKRIYHPYWLWEDYKAGMWSRKEYSIDLAIKFTGDHVSYGAAMNRVINEWPYSCEHNLTNLNHNRKAWIGHAACAIQHGMPEYIVRSAWGKLTDEQRYLANRAAQENIEIWESKHHLNGINEVRLSGKTFIQKVNNYIAAWKKMGYLDLPDEVDPVLDSYGLVGNYKRIALAILKNDWPLKSLGYDVIAPDLSKSFLINKNPSIMRRSKAEKIADEMASLSLEQKEELLKSLTALIEADKAALKAELTAKLAALS